jgi:hypothetical protein
VTNQVEDKEMTFLLSHRALLRGMLAGAVVLTGTACSRSDRTESGSDTTAAMMPAISDSVRGETAPAGDKDAAGYRSMDRDTTSVPSQPADSALPDTSVSAVPSDADTAAAETSAEAGDTTSIEMAGATDPTLTPDVAADTVATPSGDVALQTTVDTSSQDSAIAGVETEVSVGADSADTAAADVAIAADSADTVTADVAIAADSADTTDSAGRIRPPGDSTEINTEVVRVRPPEDSTELLGDVTTPAEAADETADEQIITPEDEETVAASETRTDEVGAAAIGGEVTGGEAVALMTRGGARCAVVDPEMNEAVRWDMSSTPVTLNPCGMGSMILSRIWTER